MGTMMAAEGMFSVRRMEMESERLLEFLRTVSRLFGLNQARLRRVS